MPAPGHALANHGLELRVVAQRNACRRSTAPARRQPPSVPWHAAQRLAKTPRPGSTFCASTRAAHTTATIEAATYSGNRDARDLLARRAIITGDPHARTNHDGGNHGRRSGGWTLRANLHAPAGTWSVPRMPDGHPDMQGVWANNNMTPLERPAQFGTRATMTDAELADLKKRAQKLIDGGDAFFADELILAALEGKTKFSQPTRRPATTTRRGCPSASWTTARRSSSIRLTAVFRPRRRAPPSGRAHRPRRGEAVGPPIARRTWG